MSSTWFRNLDVETGSTEGIVTGKIPFWLEGNLIRNGSGIYQIGETHMNHVADGLSVLHKFEIASGKVTYRNRILKSDTYTKCQQANRLVIHQFGTAAVTDPCKSRFEKFITRFEPMTRNKLVSDNCSVNVCYWNDELYAITETPFIRKIDPTTLNPIGKKLDISRVIAVHHSTAHPHVDPDGTVYNTGTSVGIKGVTYNILKFPPGKKAFTKAKIVATLPCRWKINQSYYHSFGITDNYFIFVEYPLILNTFKLLTSNYRQESLSSALQWIDEMNARFLLAERKTGKIVPTIYEAPPFFSFHHGNAYEKDDHIIIDLSCYKNGEVMNNLNIQNIHTNMGNSHPYYARFALPLHVQPPKNAILFGKNLVKMKGKSSACKSYWLNNSVVMCEPLLLANKSLELPRINYKRNGKFYQFVYGVSFVKNDGFEMEKILKLNVETGETKEWIKRGFSPSEPVFVSRPEAEEEDDGIIMFSALDQSDSKRVLLVILNANTFQEECVVEFKCPGIVTKDFHGIFSQTGEKI